MEKNDISKVDKNAKVDKKVSFWNRLLTGLVYLLIVILLIFAYNHWGPPGQECTSKITYHPYSGQVGGYYTIGEAGFYILNEYTVKELIFGHQANCTDGDVCEAVQRKSGKFKERKEALSFCLSNR